MFGFSSAAASDPNAVLTALNHSLAIVEFDPKGNILTANANFCKVMGYQLEEIQGRHHSMFVEPGYAQSAEYQAFWTKLGHGEFDAREYRRLRKGGDNVWIQASYNPVRNSKGAVLKVVKVAADVTKDKLKSLEAESMIDAIMRVQAVIEFTPAGRIITANDIFLKLMGYRIDEVVGQHHRLFVEPDHARSAEYEQFWGKLNAGQHIATSFKRIAKGDREVWIQASYNPVFDFDRKVVKVVKFATDITDLTEIGVGLARLAASQLNRKIEKQFDPTFEKLRLDFNVAHDNLRSTLECIADSATAIHSGTQEISYASEDLSRRTEQQAATLGETAAALDQITTVIKKSAAGANHARDVVAAANQDAKNSAAVVREAVEAMDKIAASAKQISQIIGVIDEIAFQTNLLALNAGVEAARAGDAGRGFAVVASEVRALAQRSAEAAKEIKALILASTTQTGHGVRLVAETGGSLERIMTQVNDINEIITQIAAGAEEQAQGLERVNTAIGEMDQATQQNAAMVVQTTAASHSLSRETSQLSDLVANFDVGRPHLGLGNAHPEPRPAEAMPAGRPLRPKAAASGATKSTAKLPPASVARRAAAGGAPHAKASTDWDEF